MTFLQLFAEVAGLSTFVFTAVAQLKQFNIKGHALTASAYIIGLLVGGCYRYFTYLPTSPADWFWLVMFGAAGGFLATGAYKGIESASGKTMMVKAELAELEYLDAQDVPTEDGR